MLCYSIWDEVTHARIERPVDLRARGAPRTMQTHSSSQREILPLRMPARDEKQKARFSRAIKYASPPPPPQLLLSFFLFNSLSFLEDLADRGNGEQGAATAAAEEETFCIEITRRHNIRATHTFSHTQLCLPPIRTPPSEAPTLAGSGNRTAMNQQRPPKDNFLVLHYLFFHGREISSAVRR